MASPTLRAWRALRLGLHLLLGLLTIALVFPFCGRTSHQRLRQRWSCGLLRTLGIRLEHEGEAVA
ncbi:MAG TPA: 1-acyl-sn-glycerol-3-phosphate acyltransferase, partial [Thauera sp.]|nr:1-acyl-sn-glycerol-3-phosphate acyltransferase [Thauera sp.]